MLSFASPAPPPQMHESRIDSDVPARIGGCELFVPLTSSISVDTSHLPHKLIVVINSNAWSVLQFLTFSGVVPGCFAVVFNVVGSVDELHFDRNAESTDIVMVRKRRSFCSVKVDPPITVTKVGAPDDAPEALGEHKGVDASPPDVGGQSVAPPLFVDTGVVIDGATPGRGRELMLLVNGEKMVTGTLQHATVEEEGDASAVIKAFCCLPLLRQEFLWLQDHMPDLLPEVGQMNEQEVKNYRIQMLSMDLLLVQQLQEKQALGEPLSNFELEQIATVEGKSEELSALLFDMEPEEIRDVKGLNKQPAQSPEKLGSESPKK